jgi:thiol peroxidase
MSDASANVTFKGNPMTLVGQPVGEGDTAPDFTAVKTDLSEVSLSDYRGKTVIISSVPSVDTSVCDQQTRRFNEEAAKLGDDTVVLTVSMDLPFAFKRWCAATGAEQIVPLSDYKHRSFGDSFGLRMDELGLLARAVYVVDPQGVVRHAQLVPEVTELPDFDKAVDAAKAAG